MSNNIHKIKWTKGAALTSFLQFCSPHKMKILRKMWSSCYHYKFPQFCNLGSRTFRNKCIIRDQHSSSCKISLCIGSMWSNSCHKYSCFEGAPFPAIVSVDRIRVLHKFLRTATLNTQIFVCSILYQIFAKTELIYYSSLHAIFWEVVHVPMSFPLYYLYYRGWEQLQTQKLVARDWWWDYRGHQQGLNQFFPAQLNHVMHQ